VSLWSNSELELGSGRIVHSWMTNKHKFIYLSIILCKTKGYRLDELLMSQLSASRNETNIVLWNKQTRYNINLASNSERNWKLNHTYQRCLHPYLFTQVYSTHRRCELSIRIKNNYSAIYRLACILDYIIIK